MNRIISSAALLSVLACTSALPAADAPWVMAHKAFEAGLSAHQNGNAAQAAQLMDDFVQKYSTYEEVPRAYVILIGSKSQLKDFAGAEEAADQIIRKFPGSPTWFYAYAWKLARLKSHKKYDEYLSLVESMARGLEAMPKSCREIPLDLPDLRYDFRGYQHGGWFDAHRSRGTPDYWSFVNVTGAAAPGWERDLTDVCDTPMRAQRALRIMDKTLAEHKKELSSEWEFAHYLLLLKAGKDADAQKTLAGYQSQWGEDIRGMQLWLLAGEEAQRELDDKGAQAAYDYVVKNYGKCGSLADFLMGRFDYLVKRNDYPAFVALARHYLQEFSCSPGLQQVLNYWLAMTRAHIAQEKDASALSETVEKLGKEKLIDPFTMLQWQIEVRQDSNQLADMAVLLKELSADTYWCQGTFDLLVSKAAKYGAREPAITKLLDETRQKYKVPAAEPNSPSALLLKQLRDRIKEDQVRHMEELAQEMVSKYPDDASTIDGIKAMVDYYYSKVLVEPRDKWVNVMVANYPRHPLTQAAVQRQIAAMDAASQYERLSALLDIVEKQFPGAIYTMPAWAHLRLSCYDAAKDANARVAFIEAFYRDALAKGDITAMNHLVGSRLPDPNANRARGDLWMEMGKPFDGTRAGVYCTAQAFFNYYWCIHTDNRPLERCWKEGLETCHQLQEQKIDPELRSNVEFADVLLLEDQRDANASLSVLNKKLTAKSYRDLSYRLRFDVLAETLRDSKSAGAWYVAAKGMMDKKQVYTDRDMDALVRFLGELCAANKEEPTAIAYFLKAADDIPWPVAGYWNVIRAMELCDDVSKISEMAEAFIKKVPKAQDFVPRMLQKEAELFMKHTGPTAMVAARLAKEYPVSEARGAIEGALAAEEKKAKEATK